MATPTNTPAAPRFLLWWANLGEAYSVSQVMLSLENRLPRYIDQTFGLMVRDFEPGRIWVSDELKDFTLTPMLAMYQTSLTMRGRSAVVVRYQDAPALAEFLRRAKLPVLVTTVTGSTVDLPGETYSGPPATPLDVIPKLPPQVQASLLAVALAAGACLLIIAWVAFRYLTG